MNLPQIRYFLALCEARQFNRAADTVGVSQPSLSIAIRQLERELGGALFQRRPLATLTALGQAVYPYFERIAEDSDHACEVARALTHTPVRLKSSDQSPVARRAVRNRTRSNVT
jgi:DNA-binding transcriptional LysR family regulator